MVKNISFGAHLVNIVRQAYIQNIEEAKNVYSGFSFFCRDILKTLMPVGKFIPKSLNTFEHQDEFFIKP